MNVITRPWRKLMLAVAACVFCLTFSACSGDYDVPITSVPTQKIDERLLGDWALKDDEDRMRVRKLDDSVYVICYGGGLYRAFHSDVGKIPFVSVQDLDSADRKYVYFAYKLSDDGKLLDLTVVSQKIIPKDTKDSLSVQKLLEKNLQNPELFGDVGHYVRQK